MKKADSPEPSVKVGIDGNYDNKEHEVLSSVDIELKERASAPSQDSSLVPAPPAMLTTSLAVTSGDVIVLPVSNLLRVLLPPLWVASLPRTAIGFSFPRGGEGKVLGAGLLFATAVISVLLDTAFGPYAVIVIVWLMGGTSVVILYNSVVHGLAFVKQMCSTCRLRPIIEEHEIMHLNGEPSEEVVWGEARKKYTYEGLGLDGDSLIHSFCPIAKRLKGSP